jgi:hypothetical protein
MYVCLSGALGAHRDGGSRHNSTTSPAPSPARPTLPDSSGNLPHTQLLASTATIQPAPLLAVTQLPPSHATTQPTPSPANAAGFATGSTTPQPLASSAMSTGPQAAAAGAVMTPAAPQGSTAGVQASEAQHGGVGGAGRGTETTTVLEDEDLPGRITSYAVDLTESDAATVYSIGTASVRSGLSRGQSPADSRKYAYQRSAGSLGALGNVEGGGSTVRDQVMTETNGTQPSLAESVQGTASVPQGNSLGGTPAEGTSGTTGAVPVSPPLPTLLEGRWEGEQGHAPSETNRRHEEADVDAATQQPSIDSAAALQGQQGKERGQLEQKGTLQVGGTNQLQPGGGTGNAGNTGSGDSQTPRLPNSTGHVGSEGSAAADCGCGSGAPATEVSLRGMAASPGAKYDVPQQQQQQQYTSRAPLPSAIPGVPQGSERGSDLLNRLDRSWSGAHAGITGSWTDTGESATANRPPQGVLQGPGTAAAVTASLQSQALGNGSRQTDVVQQQQSRSWSQQRGGVEQSPDKVTVSPARTVQPYHLTPATKNDARRSRRAAAGAGTGQATTSTPAQV